MNFSHKTDQKINFDVVDMAALEKLSLARDISGIPFVITSHYRSKEYDLQLSGGKIVNGPHTRNPCSAFDIACIGGKSTFKIVSSLLQAGFRRIGINNKNGHIHVDACTDLPQDVLFIE